MCRHLPILVNSIYTRQVMSVDHYENFPVASFLLPQRFRSSVEAIYQFARSADDIADEGSDPACVRYEKLQIYYDALTKIEAGEDLQETSFEQLATEVKRHTLPVSSLRNLLDAFSQDIEKTRYASFNEVLDYCQRSANPVGRLLLHLYQADSDQNLRDSDAICTSLQLINFLQDVAIDWQKGRVYLPQDALVQFGISEAHLSEGICDSSWCELMCFEINRIRSLMASGASLPMRLPGRIGWELRLVVQGGLRILDKIEAAHYDVFRHRPVLNPADWVIIGGRALFFSSPA